MASEINKTQAEATLAEQFGALTVSEAGTVSELRKSAFERFEGAGLPHRRVEAYKYTDLKRSLTDVPPIADEPAKGVSVGHASPDGAHRLTMANGRLLAAEALPDGVEVSSLRALMSSGDTSAFAGLNSEAAKLAADDPLVQLNTAFMGDGAVIRVAAGAKVEAPIDLVHALTGASSAATYNRHVVIVEAGADATFVESHLGGEAAHLSNTVVELHVGEGARARLIRRQEGAAEDKAFSTALVDLAASATLQYFSFNGGASLSRGQVFLSYLGESAHADLLGATICRGNQLLDTTLFVDHAKPHGTSTEVFKTVVGDRAQSVFQGKIIVRPHAQKTDARMMSRALLLSDEAEAINKPELEIYADDVQCAHGATVGAIDEDMLFYMLSRGLPRAEAERLLVQAFLAEPIESIDHETVRNFLLERMIERLKS